MLNPTKHSHPDQTTMNLSLKILSRLKKNRVEDYEDLLAFALKEVSGGKYLFLPSLNFLFLMGVIEYRPKTDALEYTGP